MKYINREISWLKFNHRVLQEAKKEDVPLVERIRFLGIFSNNIDEFFKVRYASVRRIAQIDESQMGVLDEINALVLDLSNEYDEIYKGLIVEFEKKNVFIVDEKNVSKYHNEFLKNYFYNKLFADLNIYNLCDKMDFPHIKDDSFYLFVTAHKIDRQDYFIIEIPTKQLGRFIVLPEKNSVKNIMFLEDLVRFFLPDIIHEYEKIESHTIKISRDADLTIDNDLDESYINQIAKSIEKRKKGEPVRFVYDENIPKKSLKFIKKKLGIKKSYDSVVPSGKYHNRRDFMGFPKLDLSENYQKIKPFSKGLITGKNVFDFIDKKDVLVHTPYHSFYDVVMFLRKASIDPKVNSIKITIYRVNDNSKIMKNLINAARNGIKVTVVIELRARFDERTNMVWANKLKNAGVRVIFGVPGLKVHAKTCIVERENNLYAIVGTGNFNEDTSGIYTDFFLITARKEITKDIDSLFKFFEKNYKKNKYKHIIVSPNSTRKKLYKLIENEISNKKKGKNAFVKLKLNNLVDKKIIEKLYEAADAGVQVKLIVRGINCLIPKQNIEAISIVDKFLEHSRVYWFCDDENDRIYISSADWMTRNLDHRVEVSCPIYEDSLKDEVKEIFGFYWSDNSKSRVYDNIQSNKFRQIKGDKRRAQIDIYEYYKQKN